MDRKEVQGNGTEDTGYRVLLQCRVRVGGAEQCCQWPQQHLSAAVVAGVVGCTVSQCAVEGGGAERVLGVKG